MARELEVALEAATAAGQVLSENFGREQAVRFKGEVDLVTEVDERAKRVIREVLLGAFPAYGVLGEEVGWSQGGGEEGARWIVDPLDGTTNYAHGLPLFCVSIALERSGEVVLGVVHDPTAEETYAAERGGGAELNGRALRVSDTDEPIRALVGSGLPYEREHLPAALELFGRLAALTQGTRRLGSVALALCYVAAGRLDGYYERGPKAWDVSAGVLLVEEAGGRVTDYRGSSWTSAEGRWRRATAPCTRSSWARPARAAAEMARGVEAPSVRRRSDDEPHAPAPQAPRRDREGAHPGARERTVGGRSGGSKVVPMDMTGWHQDYDLCFWSSRANPGETARPSGWPISIVRKKAFAATGGHADGTP